MGIIPQPRAPRGGVVSEVNGRFYKGGRFLPAAPAVEPVKVAITGFVYSVAPVAVAPEIGTVAYELHKLDTGNRYHVVRDGFGLVRCDCPDYEFRRDGTGPLCKHGAALVAKGLVPAPSPVATTLGRREFLTAAVSVLRPAAPDRVESPAPRRGRFAPTPEEMAEAAQMFGDLATAGDR
jgi:hypothetical protein